jgi:3-oxoacyl-[acyl-carrier-protein] synthase-1
MKSYINAYESISSAGNTQELMSAIYSKTSTIEIDRDYIPETAVGLGKIKENNFFQHLKNIVQTVLEKSDLDNFENTLLIVGSSVGGMSESETHYFKDKNYKNINPSRHAISIISEELQKNFNFFDTRSLSTACTSSANAMLLAKRLIGVGAYENILVVGADALCYTTVCGFHALGVLSSKPCTPFNEDREGMNVAEAIAALLIQNHPDKDAVELQGVGASSDAYHMTNPDPEANGAIASMKNAINDANLQSQDIDYINAHGTGTVANDKVEALAVEKLFGKDVHVSSTKAIIGHTLGAAAAIEAIISCEVIKSQKIPPQTALIQQENSNILIPLETINHTIKYVLSNSFAFGGNNASLLFSKVEQ